MRGFIPEAPFAVPQLRVHQVTAISICFVTIAIDSAFRSVRNVVIKAPKVSDPLPNIGGSSRVLGAMPLTTGASSADRLGRGMDCGEHSGAWGRVLAGRNR